MVSANNFFLKIKLYIYIYIYICIGMRVKDRAKNCFISRAAKTENRVPRSFFAPKPNGNACCAGYKGHEK